jgi:hypothetical protein
MMDMEGYPVQGYGKVLPPLIVHGYFQAFRACRGQPLTIAYLDFGIRRVIADPDAGSQWAQLSKAAVRELPPYPLDYAQIAVLQAGLEVDMVAYKEVRDHARQVRRFAWNQGEFWWQEYHVPSAVSPDRLALGWMVRPTVEAYLRTYQQRHRTLPDALAVLFVALRTFARISTIDLGVEMQEQQLVITTRDCPFCLNRSDWCYMLFGLVQGAIAWGNSLEGMSTAMEQLVVVELPHNNHQVILTQATGTSDLPGPGGSG